MSWCCTSSNRRSAIRSASAMRAASWRSSASSTSIRATAPGRCSPRSAPRVRTLARRKVAKARGQLETVAERVFRLGDEFGAARIIGAARNLDPRYALAALPLGRPQRSDEAFARHAAYLAGIARSEEHTSELQSLMRTSYAVFCL